MLDLPLPVCYPEPNPRAAIPKTPSRQPSCAPLRLGDTPTETDCISSSNPAEPAAGFNASSSEAAALAGHDSLFAFAASMGMTMDALGGVDEHDLLLADGSIRPELIRRLVDVGALPVGVDADGLAELWQVFRASTSLIQRYAPAPLDVRELVCTTRTSSHRVIPSWRALLSGPIQVHTIDADHHHIIQEPHTRALAARLNVALAHWQMTKTTERYAACRPIVSIH